MSKIAQPSAIKMPGANAIAQQALANGRIVTQVVKTTLQTDEAPKEAPPIRRWWIRKDSPQGTFLDELLQARPPDPPYFIEYGWGAGTYYVNPVDFEGNELVNETIKIPIGGSTMNRTNNMINQIPQVIQPSSNGAPTIVMPHMPPLPPTPPVGSGMGSDFFQMMTASKQADAELRAKETEDRRKEDERKRAERDDDRKKEDDKEEKRKREAQEKEDRRKDEERDRALKYEEEERKHKREIEKARLELESKNNAEIAKLADKEETRKREELASEMKYKQQKEDAEEKRRKEKEDAEEKRLKERADREDLWRREDQKRDADFKRDQSAKEDQWRKELSQKEETERKERERKEDTERKDRKEREDARIAKTDADDKRFKEDTRLRIEELARQSKESAAQRAESIKTWSALLTTVGGIAVPLLKREPAPVVIPPPPEDNSGYIVEAIESLGNRLENKLEREGGRNSRDDNRGYRREVDSEDEDEEERDGTAGSMETAMALVRLGMDANKANAPSEKKEDGMFEKILGALPAVTTALGALKVNAQLQQAAPAPAPAHTQPMRRVLQNKKDKTYTEQEVTQIFHGTMDQVFSDADALKAQILANPQKYGPAIMKLLNESGAELMAAMNNPVQTTPIHKEDENNEESDDDTATDSSEESGDLEELAEG